MRILIPHPAEPDNFQDNVAVTLRAMGHEVLTPPLAIRSRNAARAIRLGEEIAARFGVALDSRERWLVRAARRHRPDMVLALTQQLSPETLGACRKAGVKHLVAWWGDPPANMSRWGLLCPEWDLLCFKDPDAARRVAALGLNASVLHEAMNPAWHRVIAPRANEAVAIVGNWYAYRQLLTLRLLEAGVPVALYGPPLPLWAAEGLRRHRSNGYVVRDEKSRVFGEALGCLNSTSLAEGNSLNCRAFEIAGAGGLQFIENRPIVGECFAPGVEVLVYANVDELLELVDRARRFPAEAASIREAGARRAHSEHTYRHRLEALLERAARA